MTNITYAQDWKPAWIQNLTGNYSDIEEKTEFSSDNFNEMLYLLNRAVQGHFSARLPSLLNKWDKNKELAKDFSYSVDGATKSTQLSATQEKIQNLVVKAIFQANRQQGSTFSNFCSATKNMVLGRGLGSSSYQFLYKGLPVSLAKSIAESKRKTHNIRYQVGGYTPETSLLDGTITKLLKGKEKVKGAYNVYRWSFTFEKEIQKERESIEFDESEKSKLQKTIQSLEAEVEALSKPDWKARKQKVEDTKVLEPGELKCLEGYCSRKESDKQEKKSTIGHRQKDLEDKESNLERLRGRLQNLQEKLAQYNVAEEVQKLDEDMKRIYYTATMFFHLVKEETV
jgi:hypothetical protein